MFGYYLMANIKLFLIVTHKSTHNKCFVYKSSRMVLRNTPYEVEPSDINIILAEISRPAAVRLFDGPREITLLVLDLVTEVDHRS